MKSARRAGCTAYLVGAAFAAIFVVTTGAQATGALAVGIKNNDPRQGLSYAYSYDRATDDKAKYDALLSCLDQKGLPVEALAACRIVTTFHSQCIAVALDKGAGTPGWGWSLASDLKSAENQARDNCRAVAGPGRADYCVIDNSGCDTVGQRVAGMPPVQLSTTIEAAPPPHSGGR